MRFRNKCGILVAIVVGACASLGCPRLAMAQRAHSLVQLEGGLGYGAGGAGYNDRGAFAIDLLVGRVTAAPRRRTLAVFAAAQGSPGTGDVCEPRPGGGCLEPFPIFYSFGALIGSAWDGPGALSLSVQGGPSVHYADDGGTAFGISARTQAILGIWGPVGATLAVKGSVLPNYRGDALSLTAFGLGVAVRR